jgi:hypothetical protein
MLFYLRFVLEAIGKKAMFKKTVLKLGSLIRNLLLSELFVYIRKGYRNGKEPKRCSLRMS